MFSLFLTSWLHTPQQISVPCRVRSVKQQGGKEGESPPARSHTYRRRKCDTDGRGHGTCRRSPARVCDIHASARVALRSRSQRALHTRRRGMRILPWVRHKRGWAHLNVPARGKRVLAGIDVFALIFSLEELILFFKRHVQVLMLVTLARHVRENC